MTETKQVIKFKVDIQVPSHCCCITPPKHLCDCIKACQHEKPFEHTRSRIATKVTRVHRANESIQARDYID